MKSFGKNGFEAETFWTLSGRCGSIRHAKVGVSARGPAYGVGVHQAPATQESGPAAAGIIIISLQLQHRTVRGAHPVGGQRSRRHFLRIYQFLWMEEHYT